VNIEKAIEILEIEEASDFQGITYDFEEAARLGIEALKRCQYIAEHTDRWAGVLLPGETEE